MSEGRFDHADWVNQVTGPAAADPQGIIMTDYSTIQLASGAQLPTVGLGLWKIPNEQTAEMVYLAIKAGYRHLDAACDYGNEKEAGAGIRRALDEGLCTREDLWVTSKLWNTYHQGIHVRPAMERSLSDLGLDYLDLYLVHFPISLKYVAMEERYPPGWFFDPDASEPKMEPDSVPILETWQAMEQLHADGLAKTIGVSNFGCALIRDLLASAEVRPEVLQVESHPYLVQPKLKRYCDEQGIAFTAFSPLGAGSYVPLGMAEQSDSVLEEDVVRQIAEVHGKTAAQVVLRWGIQRNGAIIPKTSRPERLVENLDLYDFALAPEEMKTLGGLDRHKRFNDPGDFCESAFGCFFPIYE